MGHGSSVVKTAEMAQDKSGAQYLISWNYKILQLTNNACWPASIYEWLPEGAIWLAEDPGLGGGIEVMLKEVPVRTVVLQSLSNRHHWVVI